MPIPSQPLHLFNRPFADSGQKQIIPDTKPNPGRASLTEGFPTETQLPLNMGGVAPNRLDFNGLFNMLSAFSFWQQSGGLFVYSEQLSYTAPAVVVHNNLLWWCLKENGPDSANGPVPPGTNPEYWMDLFSKLANDYGSGGGSGGSILGNPVGTYIFFHGTEAPGGYFVCDGSAFSATDYPLLYQCLGSNVVPDRRGYFLRGHDPDGNVDPDGKSRTVGSTQGDAIRNITGTTGMLRQSISAGTKGSGALRQKQSTTTAIARTGNRPYGAEIYFDASLQVPTAAENRSKNFSALICIKHD